MVTVRAPHIGRGIDIALLLVGSLLCWLLVAFEMELLTRFERTEVTGVVLKADLPDGPDHAVGTVRISSQGKELMLSLDVPVRGRLEEGDKVRIIQRHLPLLTDDVLLLEVLSGSNPGLRLERNLLKPTFTDVVIALLGIGLLVGAAGRVWW